MNVINHDPIKYFQSTEAMNITVSVERVMYDDNPELGSYTTEHNIVMKEGELFTVSNDGQLNFDINTSDMAGVGNEIRHTTHCVGWETKSIELSKTNYNIKCNYNEIKNLQEKELASKMISDHKAAIEVMDNEVELHKESVVTYFENKGIDITNYGPEHEYYEAIHEAMTGNENVEVAYQRYQSQYESIENLYNDDFKELNNMEILSINNRIQEFKTNIQELQQPANSIDKMIDHMKESSMKNINYEGLIGKENIHVQNDVEQDLTEAATEIEIQSTVSIPM